MFSDQYLAITQITRQVPLLYTLHTLRQSTPVRTRAHTHTHVYIFMSLDSVFDQYLAIDQTSFSVYG